MLQGLGTDEKAIIAGLTDVSNEQRQVLKATYQEMYGQNLVRDLTDELDGNFEQVILALMTPPVLYDAGELRAAMEGAETDEGRSCW